MEFSDLKKIGLSDGEFKIYNTLLELGESTRTELAKKSGISASKIYDVANKLIEKGVISSVKKNGVIHFSAADPERIYAFLEQKQEEIEREKQLVDELMPMLLGKYKKTEEEVDIEVFYGWEGMKTVYNDIVKSLKRGEFNYIMGASPGHDSKQADIFYSQYHTKKRKKGFGTKIIFNEEVRSNVSRTSIFKESPNQMRFFLQETFVEFNVYKDTVLLIMLLKIPTIIRVKSAEAADSFRKYFNSIWGQAKP
ncbi:winged helix-turn-helix transcriptional regulator [Candidatus Woesearchaeota archaeon]|nr:winged helix-turn-helix transcriptional regulator [Candidatus Woesearchaeota archaeon]